MVIVGGGLAGMAAAAALSDAARSSNQALEIHLFEAKRNLGGRAGSFTDRESGDTVDYCQHVAMGCCTNFLHLMRWAGLERDFDRHTELTFLAPGCPPSTMRAARYLPAPLHWAPALKELAFLSPSDRRHIRRGLWRLMRMARTIADEQTMGNWLRQVGQPADVVDKFWNVILTSALGESVERVAIAPARKVFVDGFLGSREAADILVPRLPLATLFGDRLPNRLDQAGVMIHRGQRVRGCHAEDSGGWTISVEGGDPVVADALLLAVPWHALPRLVTGGSLASAIAHHEVFGRLPAAPISGIHLWLDRPLTHLPHAVIVGRLSQWVFRRPSASETSGAEHYYQVVVSAAYDLRGRSVADIQAEVMGDLESVFPEARPFRILKSRVVTDPWAVFSVTPEVEALRPPTQTGHPRVFLAGDWTRTGWPATMEGAVLSGYRAAEAIAAALGIRGRWTQPPFSPSLLARWLIRGC